MSLPDAQPLPPVLLSACLVGVDVRDDGGHGHCAHPVPARLLQQLRLQVYDETQLDDADAALRRLWAWGA